MVYKNYRQRIAIENVNKQRWLKHQENIPDTSGIYILTRTDENGFKYAYVGQAKHILTRLAQHLVGYQHIDLSLKSHKIYTPENIYGWAIYDIEQCEESALDEKERLWIKDMADKGYQMHNKTIGGQDKGKSQLNEKRPAKGYYDGVIMGRRQAKQYCIEIFTKYLGYNIKKENAICKRKFIEFTDWLDNK